MFIRSERLFLRPGWAEDWQELFERISDEGIVRNLARAPWPYTARNAQEFAARDQEHRHPHFFVTLPRDTGAQLIGCVGLGQFGDEVELGYWIARAHWGQGYATEAVRALLATARAIGHRRIVAGHFEDNPASGRVLEKTGFVRTGEIVGRFSAGRGAEAGCVQYVCKLDATSDDDNGNDEPAMAARLAA